MSASASGQDEFFGMRVPEAFARKARRMRARYARKYGFDESARYLLRAVVNPTLGPVLGVQNVVNAETGEPLDADTGVIVSTIRMGYGHYRMGIALASAAHALGRTPYWFDLLAFDSPGARMIRDLDYWYSLGSRISQRSRIFNRFVWDPLMGNAYRPLMKNYPILEVCAIFRDVYRELPPDMPILGTHPWCAHGAVHAGLRNVVNTVPDNWPLGFHLAEGALNTVQSPSAYFRFRTLKGMGLRGGTAGLLPASALRLTGHYIDHELVSNIEADCASRMKRMSEKRPPRLLLSVGGAGAQQALLAEIMCYLLPRIQDGSVTVFLNLGDHERIWRYLVAHVPGLEAGAVLHTSWDQNAAIASQAVTGDVTGLHAFLARDTFAAVYTTNLLMRGADVLLTKPSELAYYPIPKLFLERVGGHEAWGAVRGSELGDGTPECAGPAETMETLEAILSGCDLLSMFCEHILKLKAQGVYDGAYRAVEAALEKRKRV